MQESKMHSVKKEREQEAAVLEAQAAVIEGILEEWELEVETRTSLT